MIKIADYIRSQRGTNTEIGDILGVSKGMISNYRYRDHTPSFEVALRIYQHDLTVIYPYSEEALIKGKLND